MSDSEFPYLYSIPAGRCDPAVEWLRANVHPANWSIPDSEPFDGRVYIRFRDAGDRNSLHGAGTHLSAPAGATVPPPGMFRLHIGGKQVREGWRILDIQPGQGVDYVGDCADLSRFPENCCDDIYASHVVEHIPYGEPMRAAIRGFHRVLKPGGTLRISVPDLEILSRMFVHPELTGDQRYHVMRIMFGGQIDAHDFHMVGLDHEILATYLNQAEFTHIERVEAFGLFDDTSTLRLGGHLVSLNVEAVK